LFARVWAGENLDFATTIIIKPLDAPFSWMLAIFKNFGGFGHHGLRIMVSHINAIVITFTAIAGQNLGMLGWLDLIWPEAELLRPLPPGSLGKTGT
jgi:hypothetical protein